MTSQAPSSAKPTAARPAAHPALSDPRKIDELKKSLENLKVPSTDGARRNYLIGKGVIEETLLAHLTDNPSKIGIAHNVTTHKIVGADRFDRASSLRGKVIAQLKVHGVTGMSNEDFEKLTKAPLPELIAAARQFEAECKNETTSGYSSGSRTEKGRALNEYDRKMRGGVGEFLRLVNEGENIQRAEARRLSTINLQQQPQPAQISTVVASPTSSPPSPSPAAPSQQSVAKTPPPAQPAPPSTIPVIVGQQDRSKLSPIKTIGLTTALYEAQTRPEAYGKYVAETKTAIEKSEAEKVAAEQARADEKRSLAAMQIAQQYAAFRSSRGLTHEPPWQAMKKLENGSDPAFSAARRVINIANDSAHTPAHPRPGTHRTQNFMDTVKLTKLEIDSGNGRNMLAADAQLHLASIAFDAGNIRTSHLSSDVDGVQLNNYQMMQKQGLYLMVDKLKVTNSEDQLTRLKKEVEENPSLSVLLTAEEKRTLFDIKKLDLKPDLDRSATAGVVVHNLETRLQSNLKQYVSGKIDDGQMATEVAKIKDDFSRQLHPQIAEQVYKYYANRDKVSLIVKGLRGKSEDFENKVNAFANRVGEGGSESSQREVAEVKSGSTPQSNTPVLQAPSSEPTNTPQTNQAAEHEKDVVNALKKVLDVRNPEALIKATNRYSSFNFDEDSNPVSTFDPAVTRVFDTLGFKDLETFFNNIPDKNHDFISFLAPYRRQRMEANGILEGLKEGTQLSDQVRLSFGDTTATYMTLDEQTFRALEVEVGDPLLKNSSIRSFLTTARNAREDLSQRKSSEVAQMLGEYVEVYGNLDRLSGKIKSLAQQNYQDIYKASDLETQKVLSKIRSNAEKDSRVGRTAHGGSVSFVNFQSSNRAERAMNERVQAWKESFEKLGSKLDIQAAAEKLAGNSSVSLKDMVGILNEVKGSNQYRGTEFENVLAQAVSIRVGESMRVINNWQTSLSKHNEAGAILAGKLADNYRVTTAQLSELADVASLLDEGKYGKLALIIKGANNIRQSRDRLVATKPQLSV